MSEIKIVVNENLMVDALYDLVKDDPSFKTLSMDGQGEFVLSLLEAVEEEMALYL